MADGAEKKARERARARWPYRMAERRAQGLPEVPMDEYVSAFMARWVAAKDERVERRRRSK